MKAVHSTVDHFKQLSFPELSDGEKKNLKNISKTLLLRKGKDYIMLKFFPPFIVLKNKQILIMCSNLDLSLALFFIIINLHFYYFEDIGTYFTLLMTA